ncbi:MAG: alpha-glucosidase C-terminal domain-containing protein, partial [Acidimicrobiales bacterium]|nr:alpha-glucosidase C-terminal domain-containing protein [Acidimicrobiales bacterium]
MGDNIYLGDRDAVRTPMQWTPDRNGGFSSGDFAQLYLPAQMDPVYGYEAVNVESQLRNPGSFLHWVQNMISARKQHSVFGTGDFEVVDVANEAVLVFLRRQQRDHPSEDGQLTDIVLCVNNLSPDAQPVEMDLSALDGKRPVELFGRVPFPRIGQLPYFVTLPPYGFYWFSLVDELGDDLK